MSKNINKKTAREELVKAASPLLDPYLKLPENGVLIFGKSVGSVYWPAILMRDEEDEAINGDNHLIIFFEEAFRCDLIPLSRIIPLHGDRAHDQKEHILSLNNFDYHKKKPWKASSQLDWGKAFELMIDFQEVPRSERYTEITRRVAQYKEEKERQKKLRDQEKTKRLSDVQPTPRTSTKQTPTAADKPKRKSEVYSLRPEIQAPKLRIQVAQNYDSSCNVDLEDESEDNKSCYDDKPSGSTSSLKTKKKPDQRPKDGDDLRVWITDRFKIMDKTFKFDSTDEIVCSACKQQVAPNALMCCHDMPFHNKCLSAFEGRDLNGMKKVTYQCTDCQLKLCYVCKTTGSVKPTKCSKCELRYHADCLHKNWPQAVLIGTNGSITCPLHVCHTCKYEHRIMDIMRNYSASKSGSYRCIYCLATYHKGGCVPAGSGSTIMMNQYLICPRHIPSDAKKIRKLGCFGCCKKLNEKEPFAVECSSCPLVFHAKCVGFEEESGGQSYDEFRASFKCEGCIWGVFPLYGQVIWYQQPGSVYWPGLILYPKDNKVRDLYRTEKGSFSISYSGFKPQCFDNCLPSRCLPLKIGDINFLTQLNLCKGKPHLMSAYEESAVVIRLSEKYRAEKLPKPFPIYKSLEKNLYRIKTRVMEKLLKSKKKAGAEADDEEVCQCGESSELVVCGIGTGCFNRFSAQECSDSNCTAATRCTNRMFSKKGEIELALEPFIPTARKGWGLRCKTKIMEGQFIVEYIGEVISGEEANLRVGRHLVEDPLYILQVYTDAFIDAEYYGNYARLINHSCTPNCIPEKYDSASGKPVVGIFAKRDVEPMEELTFNYNYCEEIRSAFHCRCGSKLCEGFIAASKKGVGDQENKTPAQRLIVEEDWGDWDEECAICLTGGELLMCEYDGCSKVYHVRCLGLKKSPTGDWTCPLHKERSPAKRKKLQNTKYVSSKSEKTIVASGSSKAEGESVSNDVGGNARNIVRNVAGAASRLKKIPHRARAASMSPSRKPLIETSNPNNNTVLPYHHIPEIPDDKNTSQIKLKPSFKRRESIACLRTTMPSFFEDEVGQILPIEANVETSLTTNEDSIPSGSGRSGRPLKRSRKSSLAKDVDIGLTHSQSRRRTSTTEETAIHVSRLTRSQSNFSNSGASLQATLH